MQIRLLKGIQFDINDVPENLEELVQRAFTEFTAETAKDYTFEDKLLFIDKTVQKLHGDRDPSYIANDLCMTKFKLDLAWHNHLPDPDEFIESGFLYECVAEGQRSQRMYSMDYSESRRECEKIMKILVRIITAVMLWERPEV